MVCALIMSYHTLKSNNNSGNNTFPGGEGDAPTGAIPHDEL